MEFLMAGEIQILALIALLIQFQVKHFLCDFPLQSKYMLGKFKPWPDFILPLAMHSGTQAMGTLILLLFHRPEYWWLALVDFAVHFPVDRLKASPALFGRWKPDNKFFWWALGFDQMLHHLTHYFFIFMILGT